MSEPDGALAEGQPEVKPETPAPEGEAPKPEVAATPEGEKQPEKPKKGLTKRFSELTRKIRDLERENIALRQPPAAPAPREVEPKVEQFANHDEYLRAVVTQEARRVAQETLSKRDQEQSREKVEAERRRMDETFDEREESAREEFEDYDEVVRDKDLPISPPMAEAIKRSDIGPKVAYHLGKNPDLASKIAAMDSISAALAMGRIEAQLTLAPTPQVTAAKPPPKTVGASAPVDVPEDKLTAAEWIARRNKEVHRRRSA